MYAHIYPFINQAQRGGWTVRIAVCRLPGLGFEPGPVTLVGFNANLCTTEAGVFVCVYLPTRTRDFALRQDKRGEREKERD